MWRFRTRRRPRVPHCCQSYGGRSSEPSEPITETAVRELYEETGLPVKPESLKVAHVIHGGWGVEAPNDFLTVVFAAHEWTGGPENREPRKHSQVCWVGADAIPKAFVPTTSGALNRYIDGGPQVSTDGWSQLILKTPAVPGIV
ncbi:DNA mismatch repair protein MutT [Streptomyces sp. CB02120-2]|nr:DNA mismatch repair protein MutT [Streptomyces sp. CB02120-2]